MIITPVSSSPEACRGGPSAGVAYGITECLPLDTGSYPIGIKISDREMAALPITRDGFHGDWNYTLHPTRDTPELN